MDTQKSLEYYNNYQEVYTRPSNYFDELAKFVLQNYKPGDTKIKILDIGCGFGDFLASFQKILGNNAEYIGLTIANHEYNFMKDNYKFITPILGKEQDALLLLQEKKGFDIIINFHTLSYIRQHEQIKSAKEMISLLKVGGILLLGTIDEWIRISKKIKQIGDGCVQFYYHPKIFYELRKSCKLIVKKITTNDPYKIQIYKKREGEKIAISGFLIYAWYLIKNKILCIHIVKKIIRKTYAMGTS